MHSMSPAPMIHRDVKPQNVLITVREIDPATDMTLAVKVADFGTVREDFSSTQHDITHDCTKVIIGTFPYMAPEYLNRGWVNEKTDAFAFGVIAMELITDLNGDGMH